VYNNTVPKTLKEQEIFFACRRFEDALRIYGHEEVLQALDTDTLHTLYIAFGSLYDLGNEGSGSGVSGR